MLQNVATGRQSVNMLPQHAISCPLHSCCRVWCFITAWKCPPVNVADDEACVPGQQVHEGALALAAKGELDGVLPLAQWQAAQLLQSGHEAAPVPPQLPAESCEAFKSMFPCTSSTAASSMRFTQARPVVACDTGIPDNLRSS